MASSNNPFEEFAPIRKKNPPGGVAMGPSSPPPQSSHLPPQPLPSTPPEVPEATPSVYPSDDGTHFADFGDPFVLNEPLPLLPPQKISKALPALPGEDALVTGSPLEVEAPDLVQQPKVPVERPEKAPGASPSAAPIPEPVGKPTQQNTIPRPADLVSQEPIGQAAQRKVGVIGESMAVDYLLSMLETAKKLGATDLHFKAGEPAEIRTVRGICEFPQAELRQKISGTSVYALFEYFLQFSPSTERKLFEDAGYLDFSVKIDDVSMRLSAFMENSGLCLAIRFFNQKSLSLDFIGIRQLGEILKRPSGLFMTTGPTGSGKTTTLAAMIEHLNSTESKHIATVEDPIEYVFTDKRCRITQRSIPAHVKDFPSGLVSMLRQDPDVIMIGELRSVEVMRTTLLAAESGHLVLTTMHASSAVQAVSRFSGYFPSDAQQWAKALLCEVLLGATNQRLLPNPDRTKRVLCAELMLMTTAMTNLIKEGKFKEAQDSIQRQAGMLDWDTSLDRLLISNQIDHEVWRLNLRNPERPRPQF